MNRRNFLSLGALLPLRSLYSKPQLENESVVIIVPVADSYTDNKFLIKKYCGGMSGYLNHKGNWHECYFTKNSVWKYPYTALKFYLNHCKENGVKSSFVYSISPVLKGMKLGEYFWAITRSQDNEDGYSFNYLSGSRWCCWADMEERVERSLEDTKKILMAKLAIEYPQVKF